MADELTIHKAIDAFTKTLVDSYSIPCVFGNQDDTTLSNGTVSFVKQRVQFLKDCQNELGDTTSRRIDGVVVIIIHVRKGQGDADRDSIRLNVVKSFRSRVIGGATFLDPKAVAAGNTENWNLTGWQIPFFYYEP